MAYFPTHNIAVIFFNKLYNGQTIWRQSKMMNY